MKYTYYNYYGYSAIIHMGSMFSETNLAPGLFNGSTEFGKMVEFIFEPFAFGE